MTVKCIDHINIVVQDLNKAQAFFELLGFVKVRGARLTGEQLEKVTGLAPLDAEYVCLELPGATQTRLELIAYASPQGAEDPNIGLPNHQGLRHLAFVVDDIESEVQKLKDAGVKLQSEVQVYQETGKKLVYFYGPEGVLLEYCEYPS